MKRGILYQALMSTNYDLLFQTPISLRAYNAYCILQIIQIIYFPNQFLIYTSRPNKASNNDTIDAFIYLQD